MTETEQEIFSDLAKIVIYHFCDVTYKTKAHAAARRLRRCHGIFLDAESTDDAWKAYEQYEKLLVAYVEEHLPSTFTLQHDYWGCKCFSDGTRWEAPKDGLYSGDHAGQLVNFEDFAALEEYTRTYAVPHTEREEVEA